MSAHLKTNSFISQPKHGKENNLIFTNYSLLILTNTMGIMEFQLYLLPALTKRDDQKECRIRTPGLYVEPAFFALANSDVGKLIYIYIYIYRNFYLHPSYIINGIFLRASLLLDITHLNRGSYEDLARNIYFSP